MASFERLEPDTDAWAAFIGNHRCRYAFAAQRLRRCQGVRRVLDAATGVGYGAAQIANDCGADVVAVDRDVAALQLARVRFAHPRVRYEQDDCTTLRQAEATGAPYDAAVSFETIEHLTNPTAFLRRVFELLRADGVLIASTPNATVTLAERGAWQHHEREYTAQEFEAMLNAAGFGTVELYGQQLTPIGTLRRDVRAELNRLRSNPVTRLGTWMHRMIRGVVVSPALPEQTVDFAIEPIESAEACVRQGVEGPFVLVAVAKGGAAR